MTLTYLANNLWLLGFPDQALKRVQESLGLAKKLSHPYSLAWVMFRYGQLHRFRHEPQATQEYAKKGIELSVAGGFTALQGWGDIELGWSQAMQGEAEEGIVCMQRGLAAWRSIGTELAVSEFLVLQAEGYEVAGQVEDGLHLVDEAFAMMEKNGEGIWEAEVHRVKGDLLKLSGETSEAEYTFRRAIEVARRQEAKSLELRATISLTKLLKKEGRSEEVWAILSEIYAWFTEGFDAPDLKEAKALLEELG